MLRVTTWQAKRVPPKKRTRGSVYCLLRRLCPADDPQIAILVAIDEPTGAHGGGAVAAPIAGDILEKVLTYLNVEPRYDDKEMANVSSVAPSLVGLSPQDAKTKASAIP